MKLFGFSKPKIQGEIGYHGLSDWWLQTFTEAERHYIEKKYKPLSAGVGGSPNKHPLTQGNILSTSQDTTGFLSGLASWFQHSEKDRDIARRILTKAVRSWDRKNVISLHFAYQGLIEVWYSDREKLPQALDETIKACQAQIQIAPQVARAMKKEYRGRPLPRHVGFQQLTIIYDKQGRYADAIKIAQEAKRQGWNGDWDKRIERYQKKLNKQK